MSVDDYISELKFRNPEAFRHGSKKLAVPGLEKLIRQSWAKGREEGQRESKLNGFFGGIFGKN